MDAETRLRFLRAGLAVPGEEQVEIYGTHINPDNADEMLTLEELLNLGMEVRRPSAFRFMELPDAD